MMKAGMTVNELKTYCDTQDCCLECQFEDTCSDDPCSWEFEEETSPYKVVTLCGSTKFKDAFIKVGKRLALEGNIVLSVAVFGHSGDSEVFENPKVKDMLDDMHKRKIDMCDFIYVINEGGYIGASTQSEIAYAKAHGKTVLYMEN